MNRDHLAFVFDDLTEFYAMRELIDALLKEKIPLDIIIPNDSGYNGLATHTFEKVKSFGYKPIDSAPKNKTYKVLISPYPTLKAIRDLKFIYHLRMPYSTITAKPNPTYIPDVKIDYDGIFCFNKYEVNFLTAYGADCYAVPYWKYCNFKKEKSTDKKPTLLILPTFGNDTSCVQYLSKPMMDKIKKHFKVVIKAHHATHFGLNGKDDSVKLEELADEFYTSDMPIVELLKKADIVLSDNSGSIFEAIYSGTPVAAFSKDLNARHLEGIDTLQYKLMKDGILPHTDDPDKILPMLLKIDPYFKKQQKACDELFIKVKSNPTKPSVDIIKDYLSRDHTKDYKKILHDLLLKEWFKHKTGAEESEMLRAIITQKDEVLNSRPYRMLDKALSPYKKLKNRKKGKK
ncbi:hypothetical protein IJS18_01290 [Candidatus Saccharibacteria bacterium]|nr:hypothetical protein [Candidatus Saccharibacteria bacterium]